MEEHDKEGRLITLEFEDFYFLTVYTPNSQSELKRLSYRMDWERDFLAYMCRLEEKKPVICCGDMNVAHQEIDLKNPRQTIKTRALQTRKEPALQRSWRVVLLILSGIFILTRKDLFLVVLSFPGQRKECRVED